MKLNNKAIKSSLFTATTIALLSVTACILNNQTQNSVNATEIRQTKTSLAKVQNSSIAVKETSSNTFNPEIWDQAILTELNRLRAQNGLKPVTLNSELTTFAQGRSETLKKNQKLSHDGNYEALHPNKCTTEAIEWINFTMGKNTDAKNAVAWFYDDLGVPSFGHRKSLLNPYMSQVGIGVVDDYIITAHPGLWITIIGYVPEWEHLDPFSDEYEAIAGYGDYIAEVGIDNVKYPTTYDMAGKEYWTRYNSSGIDRFGISDDLFNANTKTSANPNGTESGKPTTPTNPTEPTPPTEPTNPTNPTEPTEPTTPTNPTEPTTPTEPTNPTEPTTPTNPTNPTTPSDTTIVNITNKEIRYINYVPNYYVREYTYPDQSWTGQQIKHGTMVTVKAVMLGKDVKWYKLDNGLWIKGQYLTDVLEEPFTLNAAKINYVHGYNVKEYNSPDGLWSYQYIHDDTSVSVTKQAFYNGEKWYKLNNGYWVKAQYVRPADQDGSEKIKGIATINYVPGYGIAVYRFPGYGELVMDKKTMNFKRLPHGTSWKVFKRITVNGIVYYNLGGEQWIDGRYAILTQPTFHQIIKF